MKKIRKFGLTNQKESVELRRTLIKQKKETKTMIKAIAITLCLGALTATANTLPPTPEAPASAQL